MIAAILTRLRALVRSPAGWVFALCAAGLLLGYCTNDNRGKQAPGEPGDGQYHPQLDRGDGHMLYLMTRSLVFDGDLNFDNDLKMFNSVWPLPKTKTGQLDVPHPIGPALVWAPWLVVAHGLSKVANVFGANIASHGYTMFHQRIVFFSSPLFALAAALFGFWIARRWVGGRWAPLYGVVAGLLGTSLLCYATVVPSYGHAMDAGFCGAFLGLWALTIGELGWRRFVWLGVLLGVCGLIRTQDLALGIVVAVEIVWSLVDKVRARVPLRETLLLVARGAATLGVALAVFSIQLLAWRITTGDWLHAQNGPRYVRFAHPMMLELLFASRNGWFSTTPLAYASVIGLFLMPKRARLVQVGLLAAVWLQVYLNSCVMDWWGQAAFGQRRMCSVTAALVVGFAALVRVCGIGATRVWPARPRAVMRGAHALAAVVVLWFVTWNWTWVNGFRNGIAAGFDTGPVPMNNISSVQRAIARPIYDAVGNPFAFPANVLFAVRHGVPPRSWEMTVGEYVWDPPHDQYNDGRYLTHVESWRLAEPGGDRYVVRGFAGAVKEQGRWTRALTGDDAAALVPILLPETQRFTLPVSGAATISWNGEQVATATGAAWSTVTWDADVNVGMNTLEIAAAPGTEVGDLSVGFPR
jgi:hypothetical protein